MGRFVVLEGLDGAGTTTQTTRLAAWLEQRGRRVVATREPTDGPVGRIVRTVLRAEPGAPHERTLPWLFAADRADHLSRTIEPTLASGGWVVSDRYFHSSLAYQSIGLSFERVYALNQDFHVPELTLFLRVPVDVCLARISGRSEREIFEVRERLVDIASSYDRVMANLSARGHRIVVVDGTRSPDEVHAEIVGEVDHLA